MRLLKLKRLGLLTVLVFTLFIVGCKSDDATTKEETEEGSSVGNGESIELTLVEWDSEVASANVVGQVLEDLGYEVTITPLDMSLMWSSVATGEADAMLAAWLPGDQKAQYEEYGDRVVDLGPNLEGAKIGLVVPKYMDVNSIEDLDSQADSTITGIDPGAGVVTAAEKAIVEYANLESWEIDMSSGGAMVTALDQAYENEKPIVVTGWSPHWKFASYDLKYLEDPLGAFGDEEYIGTMVREDLETDMPEAFQVLDEFYWTPEDMEEVMLDISEGVDPEAAAAKWIEENEDTVSEWTKGIK